MAAIITARGRELITKEAALKKEKSKVKNDGDAIAAVRTSYIGTL